MHLLRHLLQFSGDSVDLDDDQSVEWSEPIEFSINVKNSTFTEASLVSPQTNQRNSSASTVLASAVETAETKVVTPFKDVTEGKSEISGGNETITDKTSIIRSAESKLTAEEHAPVTTSLDGWRSDRITIEVTTVDQTVNPLTMPTTTTMEIQIEPTNTFLQLSPSSMPAITVELDTGIDVTKKQVSNTQAQSFMTTLVITPVKPDVPQVISMPTQLTTTSNDFVPTTAILPIYLTEPVKAPPSEMITTTNETLVAPLKPPTLYTATLARDLEAMEQVPTVATDPGVLLDDDFNTWPATLDTTLGTKLGANLSTTLGEYRTRFHQQTIDLLNIISYPLKILTDSITTSVELMSTFGTTKENSFLNRSATLTTSQTKLDSRAVTEPESVITTKLEPLTPSTRSMSTPSSVTPSHFSAQTMKSEISAEPISTTTSPSESSTDLRTSKDLSQTTEEYIEQYNMNQTLNLQTLTRRAIVMIP